VGDYTPGPMQPFIGPPPEVLAAMTDEDVAQQVRSLAVQNTPINYEFWIDELARRKADAQNERIARLTASMEAMTRDIKRYTLLGVGIAGVALLVAVIALIVTLAN